MEDLAGGVAQTPIAGEDELGLVGGQGPTVPEAGQIVIEGIHVHRLIVDDVDEAVPVDEEVLGAEVAVNVPGIARMREMTLDDRQQVASVWRRQHVPFDERRNDRLDATEALPWGWQRQTRLKNCCVDLCQDETAGHKHVTRHGLGHERCAVHPRLEDRAAAPRRNF